MYLMTDLKFKVVKKIYKELYVFVSVFIVSLILQKY